MTSRSRTSLSTTLCVAFLGTAAVVAAPARADTTIVTETTTHIDLAGANISDLDGLGDLNKPLELAVAYRKGSRSRYDAHGQIILRGLQSGTISILNPATQTYYITTESDEAARKGADSSMVSATIGGKNIGAKSRVTALRGTRTILGLAAKGVHFDYGIDFKPPPGTSDGPDSVKLTVDGDIWASTHVPNFPTEAGSGLAALPTSLSSLFGDVAKKIQGNGLSVTFVFHVLANDKDHKIKMQIVVHEDVRAISHAPLSDDLFAVPDGYRLVPPPAKPAPPAAGKSAASVISTNSFAPGA